MPCAFRTGKYGKNVWTGKSRERESSYGDSKRWVRHEKGANETENKDTHATNTHEKCAKYAVSALCAEKCDCNR